MQTFTDVLKEKARQSIKTIVLAEGEELRSIKAAEIAINEKYAKIILLGNADKINAMAASEGVDVSGAQIIDPENSDKSAEYAQMFYELRKNKGVTPEQAAQTVKNTLYYGVMMVKCGDADGMVAGAVNSSANVLRPALQILKTAPGTKLVSAFFIMDVPNCDMGENGTFIFADCALNQNPTADEVSEIAISSAQSFKNLVGAEPTVAML
ncbi:MAG: phosphate acetyltransferase, partial [Clostridia bacterium]|nr:phosphate acetyltransferase [Clostridia bacterium]